MTGAPYVRTRGGRVVLWGARRRDIVVNGNAHRTMVQEHRGASTANTKRGKRIGW